MSDYSTDAMKQKLGYVLRWEIDDPNDNMSKTTEVEVNDHRFISEQRYQQLKIMAKYMMDLIDASRAIGSPFSLDQCEMLSKQLKALGVIMDD